MSFAEHQENVFTTSHCTEGTKLAKSKEGDFFSGVIKKYVESGNILDLGCNDGGFTDRLREFGYNAVGIDLPKVVNIAKKKYPQTKFISADLSKKIPFPDESFDLITAFDIIEHLEDDKKFLSECYRVLRKGGFLVLSTPNKFYFVYRALILLGREWEDAMTEVDTHVHSYSFKKMTKFLEHYGFSIIKKDGMYYEDSKLKTIEKILPKNFKMTMLFISRK